MEGSDGAEAIEVGGEATPLPHQVTNQPCGIRQIAGSLL